MDATVLAKEQVPEELLRRAVVEDLDPLSATRDVLATSFDNLLRFPSLVTLEQLRNIGAEGSANFQTTTAVASDRLAEFWRWGGRVPDADEAIISIHPSYADAILEGTKTIELRRRTPELRSGMRLWIYATQPTGAVIGHVTIQEVAKAHPTTIWRKHREGAGVDLASYKAYFDGAKEAVAILLEAARRVGPITIEQLREIRDRFHPPQVLTHLTVAEAKALRRLAQR